MNYKQTFLQVILCISYFLLAGNEGISQSAIDTTNERSWYESYDTCITTRLYFSQKYLSMVVSEGKKVSRLRYRPNSDLAVGIGATYGWFTVNVSYAFDFLNPGDKGKGDTKNLDLQTHIYGPKAAVDLIALYYKGMYLFPQGTATNDGSWYVRPDVALWQIGASGYYALNWRKFSYRASLLQNEWQQRSAGSLLVGLEFYLGQNKGDSALVPALLAPRYKSFEINRSKYFDIGPGFGYAYTLVVAKHWFATASVTGSLSFDWLTESSPTNSSHQFSLRPNINYKGGIGYNSKKFTASITWVNNTVGSKGQLGDYSFLVGNARMHFAYRLNAGPKFKKTFGIFQKSLF